uniref:Peroxisomal biogenesis factor 19 n=1 Tax=Heterorhabditis bacteriophora TaxID=37862 RepID=A0A1I7WZ25_HETBA
MVWIKTLRLGHSDQPSPTHSSPSGTAPSQPPPSCPTPSLAPPPPVAPRRTILPRNSAPEVGRRLENLQLAKMEDVFDDSFDPRANEKSKNSSKEYDPFGDDFLDEVLRTGDAAARAMVSKAEGVHPTPDDFQAMIDKVDKRLAEMSSGFSEGKLEMGEVLPGESFRDLEDGEYGTPVDAVNTNITGLVKK